MSNASGPEEHDDGDLGDSQDQIDRDPSLQAVAGILARGIAGELARPLRELRETIAVMVESLERHLNEAGGPTPYPWKSVQLMRQELADAYLLSRETARMASDLHEALDPAHGEAGALDANRQIEAAIALARHRISDHTELFVDLGSIPPIHAPAGAFTLSVAKLVLACAESARLRDGSAISIKSRVDHEDHAVVIYVADNGAGVPAAAASAVDAVAPVMARLGGRFDGVSEPGHGSVYECRFPLPAPG